MKYIKLILLLSFILLISFNFVYGEVYYSLENDEFGNIAWGINSLNGLNTGGPDNLTACIPFVAGYSGWLDSITFDWVTYNQPVEWWISQETVMHKELGLIHGYVGANGTIDFPNFYDGTNNYKMLKGGFYYLCIRGTDTVDLDTISGTITEYVADGKPSNYGISDQQHYTMTPADTFSNNPIKIFDYYTGQSWEHIRTFQLSGLCSNCYEEKTDDYSVYERPKYIEFCWKRGFLNVDDDNCYFQGTESGQHYITTDSTDEYHWVGEKFVYTLDDGFINQLTMYIYGGTSINNAETLIMRFWSLDSNYDYDTLLFNSSPITATNIKKTNISNFTVNTHNIFIENDKRYLIEFSCASGCSGGSDIFSMAHNSPVPTSKYKQGFQDIYAYGYQNNSGAYSDSVYDGIFKLGFTYNVFTESEDLDFSTEFCGKTNIQNCLFFDNFDYADYYDLTTLNYSMTPSYSFYVENETLIHNNSFYGGIIERDFTTKTYTYDMIKSVHTFNTKFINTPSDLEIEGTGNFLTFIMETYCDDSLTHQYRIVFYRFLNSTSSLSTTHFNIYETNGDNFDEAGTFLIRNGNNIVLNNDVDFIKRKGYLYISSDTLASSVFNGIATGDYVKYVYDLDFSCEPDKFLFYKSGLHNDTNKFVTLDSVLYYGFNYDFDGDIDETVDDDYFNYDNQTTQDDAIIKGEIGEKLHNMAFTLGFKSASSKMLFWIILMILILLLFSNSEMSFTAKTYIGSFLMLMLFVIGKYYLFIPLPIFVFILFIVAVIGGIFFFKIFSGNSAGGV